MDEKKRLAFKQGLLVFLGLVALSGIEFAIGLFGATGVLVVVMVVLALAKAGLVLWYYMHVRHVFQAVKGGDE
ncbi:MAG TPA: cytochrome C oxidase subunit IV family protein [Anaerolineaceae bacterium]|nr:cytochrome C oxidase subunit IV family protein [Anaerolineaceae bacterium]